MNEKWHSANICTECWKKNFCYEPIRLLIYNLSTCCYCGCKNNCGIYVREDANKLKCKHADSN